MVNIGTGVAPVIIVFSTSKIVALFERKMLQNTTFSLQLHHYTMSRITTQVFTLSDVLGCVSVHCADQRPHSIPVSFKKNVLILRCKRVLT